MEKRNGISWPLRFAAIPLGSRPHVPLSTPGSPLTIFQKIIDREVEADIVYEDDRALAFRDIHPQAPVHVLVIPKQPLLSVAAATDQDEALLGHLLLVARTVAQQEGIAENGYRIVTNNGAEGGQVVQHLHLHVLGGRAMTWPPG